METRQVTGEPVPNDTQAPMLIGATGSLLLVAILLLFARLWSRLGPISNLGMEDWTVVGATVYPTMQNTKKITKANKTNPYQILAMVKFLLVILACSHGFGRHALFVTQSDRSSAFRLLFACQVIWYWSITLVKLSVALLLLRLKPGRAWRIFLFSTMGVLVLSAMVQTIFQFLQCQPFRSYWDPSVFFSKGGVKCVPERAINGNIIAGSAVHVSTDLIFSFVPITFIRKLNRPRGEKIILGVLMGLGLFASSFAILRTVGLQAFETSKDLFRTSVMLTLWAMLEQEVALIAATIPTLKSIMQRSLVKIGRFFYDQDTETQVWNRLVQLGFLGTADDEFSKSRLSTKRKPSKPDIQLASFGSPTVPRKWKDEFGDTIEDGVVVGDIGLKTVRAGV
ncbi:Nn.00g082620.m01.CDS01 [Neocucurbitaria sp. VM-36]